ncbi:MAG TPA: GxxExxY protein [Gemmatimonadaceae bacterium]|nr:GxxExxY protein [Gemmatimonadaceae bacterium]
MIRGESEEKLFHSVIGSFYEVYNFLGFGFLEHHYVRALEWELAQLGHEVGREVGIQMRYKHLDLSYMRLDMVVDGKLIVEVKSAALLPSYASRQIFNYLKASNLEIGLLLHFGPKPVFHRVFCRGHHKFAPRIPPIPSMGKEDRQ